MNFNEMMNVAFPNTIWVVFLVCVGLSALGFFKFVYFLSVGYGFSVCGAGIAVLFMYGSSLSLWGILLCILLMIYGIRLGGFLLWRDMKSVSYRKTISSVTGEKQTPVFVKIAIWLCASILYVLQVSPVFYRASNGDEGGPMAIVGTIIMAVAVLIESIADWQKAVAKKENPNRFCDRGLYRIVRCPNYLGELLFWTGVLLSGFGSLKGAVQWIVALLGYVLIVYVMFSGAKRLELRQNKYYSQDPDYKDYIAKTPIILPFVPLYHLENVKFIV